MHSRRTSRIPSRSIRIPGSVRARESPVPWVARDTCIGARAACRARGDGAATAPWPHSSAPTIRKTRHRAEVRALLPQRPTPNRRSSNDVGLARSWFQSEWGLVTTGRLQLNSVEGKGTGRLERSPCPFPFDHLPVTGVFSHQSAFICSLPSSVDGVFSRHTHPM
jgi:hypothetical protein